MLQETVQSPDVRKGLAGVVVDYTAISKVNPETNSLLYRGYPVQELATKCSFEEVAYLLWNGELPNAQEFASLVAVERTGRALDPTVRAVMDSLPVTAHPMDVCRTAASVMGARHELTEDSSPEANLRKAVDLWAAMPAVVAYDQRRRLGQEVVEPRDDLDYSANFLWMTFGEEPAEDVVEAFNVSMILYAEHSFNASTFTGRVVTSSLSDLHSAVTAAIGALKGPLHGGANEAVMHTFDEIGIRPEESPEDAAARARAWMEDALAHKKKVMGFGHRVYKHGDSRVPTMKAALDKMIAHYGRPELLGLYNGLEQAMDEAKAIKPNLDYPAGPTYHLMGFDTQTFTPIFVASRITGWTAHIMEQLASNSLIRPLSEYNGHDQRSL
ncbi:bifunctional 2-methylcitrate synthase/citrate synthase [Paenarthrobacter ureafaciens]|uniref:bifunctional 2-methylcitrate synthase/citrate synthase n=1 Tax=Paenarthrobacter ureafaciens TaxID=37931 RepID=UPI002DC0381F|nr:bifunctional 2-methylcitrate synthase/citrate synthase [Paenarthrobacter ureafaciens]MEC3853127.1 bifunctional 2-methylcitrate synthase/citrate synthase [Paenarthrobacter ureafaciens]